MPPMRKKSLKEQIENNIIVVLTAAVVAAVTTTAGVMTFINTEKEKIQTAKFNSQIEDLKAHIAAIDRSLGGQSKLDIRKMLREEDDAIGASEKMRYFELLRYKVADKIDGLTYARSTELKIMAEMAGKPAPQAFDVLDELGG